jgi:DNA-binding transcriptional ArsR family regulator
MAYSISEDYKADEITLARFAKAMGHPARIAILKYLLSLDTCCFGDINKELPISKATVSQHLAELKDAGLIQGSIEPPRVNYCIDKENMKKAMELYHAFFGKKNKKRMLNCCK